jgi:hypothetical protein
MRLKRHRSAPATAKLKVSSLNDHDAGMSDSAQRGAQPGLTTLRRRVHAITNNIVVFRPLNHPNDPSQHTSANAENKTVRISTSRSYNPPGRINVFQVSYYTVHDFAQWWMVLAPRIPLTFWTIAVELRRDRNIPTLFKEKLKFEEARKFLLYASYQSSALTISARMG